MAITKVTSGLISADASSIDLNIDAGTLYLDVSENRVGIGTTSPTQKLDVDSGHIAVDAGYGLVWSGDVDRIITPEDNSVGGLFKVGASAATRFMRGSSESMRIDSSGNLLVGTTDSDLGITDGDSGVFLNPNGYIQAARDSFFSLLYLNKLNNDGSHIDFYKDGSPVGSIGTTAGVITIGNNNSGGIIFGYNGSHTFIEPSNTSGASVDDGATLGSSSKRFRDLYLSGVANVTSLTAQGGTGNAYLQVGSDTGSWTFKNYRSSHALTLEDSDGTGEVLRVDTSGNLLVGGTSIGNPSGTVTIRSKIQVGGTEAVPASDNYNSFQAYNRGDSGVYSYVSNVTYNNHMLFLWRGSVAGSITSPNSASVAYNTSSDYRLKENVDYEFNALDRVAQLKPARFNFIVDADRTVDGFLAHEVQDIVPEAITGEKDAVREEEYEVTPAVLDDDGNVVTEAVMGTREVPEYQGIDQSKLVPLLTKAIQELSDKVDNQQTIIDNLTTRIETLENA